MLAQLNAALEGRYTVERLVGEGGMATVYLARDLRHRRNVALKVLRPDLGAVLGLERFSSEIQVTANLQHPNLLPLFDSGAAGDLLFYVMPFVEGESLRARLDREKQLPIDEAIRLATAVASALDYAHRHGVIHRDLKPENVMLHEGQPLVADFGIALAVSNAGGNRITQTGLSLGTPQYMSPEQATGDRVMDGRTDVYSLGAVTYEMLTGEPPHTGTTSQAVIARVLTERPRPIRSSRPSVPEHVEAAVERALEKLPADRWGTPKEFAEALSGARIVTRTTTASVSRNLPSSRPAVREYAAWLLAAAGLGGVALFATRPEPEAPPVVPMEFALELPDSVVPVAMGSAASVAFSRDGSTLVFQGTRAGGTPMLFVRRMDDRVAVPIRGTDSARSPVLSPDGSEVLFAVLGGNQIKRIPIRGGTPRILTDSASTNGQVSWGDAGLIVFAHRRGIWTMPQEGGPRTLLAAPDSLRSHHTYGFPDVLPGGRAAIITIWKGVFTLDSTTVGVVTIPEGKVTELNIRGVYPRYSSTGHLLYLDRDARLHAVAFSAGSGTASGQPFPVAEGVRTGTGGAGAYGVSNGTLVYQGGGVGGFRGRVLVAVNRTGTERPLNIAPGHYYAPRISPDGRQVALTVTPEGAFQNPDVWTIDLGSSALTRVTTDSASIAGEWSLDGERIGFIKMTDSTAAWWRPLYTTGQATELVRLATGSVREITFGKGDYAALRVNRGTSGSQDIWLVHLDSLQSPRAFLAEAYHEFMPRISPDGRLMAYVTNRTGHNEVYVRPLLGDGGEVQVSVRGGAEPVWSDAGNELFYRTDDFLMAARVAGGTRLTIARRDTLFRNVYIRLGGTVGNYDVFPGGNEFLMVRLYRPEAGRPELLARVNWHVAARGPSGLDQP